MSASSLVVFGLRAAACLILSTGWVGSARALSVAGVVREVPEQSIDKPRPPSGGGSIFDGYEHAQRRQLGLSREIPLVLTPGQVGLATGMAADPAAMFLWSPEASITIPSQLKKVSRVSQLRQILGSDWLQLPPPAAPGQTFMARPVPAMDLDDAVSAAIGQSFKVAAVESREAYGEALTGVARAALLPQVKIRAARGKEKSSPASDTYSYAKKDICLSPDGTAYQDCVAGGTLAYPTGSKVPASKHLLQNPSARAPDATSLLGESFAYNSITMDRSDLSLSVAQSLFDYGAWAEVARQKKVHAASQYAVQGERLKAMLDAATSYVSLFQNSLALRFAQEYEQALLKLYERIDARVRGGAGSEVDLERLKGRRVNARSTVLDARNSFEVELTNFQKLTGKRPDRIGLPPDWLIFMPESMEAALIVSAESNPALQADLKQAESILEELRKSKAGFLPNLNLELSVSNSSGMGASNSPVLTSESPSCGIDPDSGAPFCNGNNVNKRLNKLTQSIMITMNWNVFSGGGDYYQSRAAAEKYNEAMFRLLDTRRDIGQKLHSNFESLGSTSQRVEEIGKEVEANQRVVASFTEQMFVANRSLLDVLDAHQRLYQSRLDYVRLLIAEANLAMDVLYNMGTLTRIVKRPDEIPSPRGTMGSLVGQDAWNRNEYVGRE